MLDSFSIQVTWIGLMMGENGTDTNQKNPSHRSDTNWNGFQPRLEEGFNQILALRDLQPDPVSHFGASYRSRPYTSKAINAFAGDPVLHVDAAPFKLPCLQSREVDIVHCLKVEHWRTLQGDQEW